MNRLKRLQEFLQEIEAYKKDEDFPGEVAEHRRAKIIEMAVEAADELIMEGSDGSVEETDFLTAAVAMRFNQKVYQGLTANLLRKQIMGDK